MKIVDEKKICEIKKEIDEIEKLIEEQKIKNNKIKKKNMIVCICVFCSVIVFTIFSHIYHSKELNKQIENYRIQTEEQIKVYEQEINELQQRLDSME